MHDFLTLAKQIKEKKLEQHHKSSLMDAGSHLLEVIAMVLSYKKTTLQKNVVLFR